MKFLGVLTLGLLATHTMAATRKEDLKLRDREDFTFWRGLQQTVDSFPSVGTCALRRMWKAQRPLSMATLPPCNNM
jgi:hypothetical protein